MLRITQAQTKAGQRWTLSGRLTGPWVDELRTCWEHGHQTSPSIPAAGTHEVVDLSDVTVIDESGEKLLQEMRSSGADLVGCGLYTEHLLKHGHGKTKESK